MVHKVAVLIDGGYFQTRFKSQNQKSFPQIQDVNNLVSHTIQKVQGLSNSAIIDVLFRIFYYDCKPFSKIITDPTGKKIDYSYDKNSAHRKIYSYQNELRLLPQTALRLGELSFDGWKDDPNNSGQYLPIFKQKSVDMKIGLDIAWLASKRIVDKLVLVAGDSDFIAPMKFARREGLLVYLETMGQQNVKMELKEHADFLV